jgi:hypothetical protein
LVISIWKQGHWNGGVGLGVVVGVGVGVGDNPEVGVGVGVGAQLAVATNINGDTELNLFEHKHAVKIVSNASIIIEYVIPSQLSASI